MPMRWLCRLFACALLAMAAPSAALAQAGDYPSRVIHVIVGFAAGGGNDLFARLVAQKVEESTGIKMVIENRPGAGGRLAADYVAHQPADGYTIMVAASGAMSIAAAIYPDLPYHPTRSFIPLNMIASFPLVMVVNAKSPARSVHDLVAWGKANPDKSNYATSSPAFTIPTELFKLKTGMPAMAIPYKSSSEANRSVVAGETTFAISDGGPAVPLVKGGQTRALAVTGGERSAELPDVPSMSELGLPDVNTQLWSGFFVPAGTPQPIVDRLIADLGKALADSDVQARLKAMAVNPGGPSGKAFAARIDEDIESFSAVVKAAKLTFQ
jgi:tripartite-type tricarboxylate transporter receptor subunit TctC